MKHSDSDILQEAWGEFLGDFDWDHWATLTFRPYAPPPEDPQLGPSSGPREYPGPLPDYARRAFERYVSELSRRARCGLAWFRGDEFGARFGRLHHHALIQGTAGLTSKTLRSCWRDGFSVVESYDPELGASHYIAKYVTKSLGEYELGGVPRRLAERAQRELFGARPGDAGSLGASRSGN